ncbi:MAG TPA: universal stress protein, partial [Planctomycetaceae bacterium]|nr:universal stress protein [Planctomycetaceae bacterium]
MNILLAIDGSAASDKAVRFVGDLLALSGREDLKVTLLHVAESLPDELLSLTDPSRQVRYRTLADELDQAVRTEGERLLTEERQSLIAAGFPATAIETKLVVREGRPEARKVIASLAIIDEMQNGPCDVVCLGRRGTGAAGAAMGSFPGSVAEKVL